MKLRTKITLTEDDGAKVLGEGPCRLLEAVARAGSLNRAAAAMDMSYTKALKLVKQAEQALGYSLLRRTQGGRSGGGSVLTPAAEHLLRRYNAYQAVCRAENRRRFRDYFPEIPLSDGRTAGCVILASGMGRRFGGNKLMADFLGEPVIGRVLDAVIPCFDRLIVVTRSAETAAYCRGRGVPVLCHSQPEKRDSIRLGLEALAGVSACMFCPGDQPLLTAEVIEQLLAAHTAAPDRIIRPESGGMPGAPVLFPARFFPELLTLSAGESGSALLRRYPAQVLGVEIADGAALADADTPEELERLRQLKNSCPI